MKINKQNNKKVKIKLKITILVCVDSWTDLDSWYTIYVNYWWSFAGLLKIFVLVRTLFSIKT